VTQREAGEAEVNATLKCEESFHNSGNSPRWAGSPEILSPVFRGMVQLMLSLCGQEQESGRGCGERLVVCKNVTSIAWQQGSDSPQGLQIGEDPQLYWIKTNYDLKIKSKREV
jgi:hypothetical protein